MKIEKIERLLALLKREGVSHFKYAEIEIRLETHGVSSSTARSSPELVLTNPQETKTAASAPPVEITIPHHVNEVTSLLRLKDEDLVEKLFPDYSQRDLSLEAKG